MSIQVYDKNGQPYEADLVDGEQYRQLERENAALREDKERLNWLLTHEGGSWLYWAIENGQWTPEVAASRAAIDAARNGGQP